MDPDPLFERLRDALGPDYRLERLIGTGGMGKVYLATDLTLNSPVAVKVLRPELDTAHGAEAFMREAQLMARVRHPNVVTIYHAYAVNGLHFYIMEFVDGPTLQQRLEHGPLSRGDSVKLGRDLLDGLEAVHREGVVHRDIKPSNLFVLDPPLRAKLSDFGIARAPTPPQRAGNARRSVMQEGTPGYRAPEQISGDAITPATDLYQAGLVIYEAMTNERYLDGPAPSWRGIPGSIAGVLRRALQDDTIERWPDARKFRHALWRTRILRYLVRAALLTIGGMVVGAVAVLLGAVFPRPDSPGILSVALPPFDYLGPAAHRPVADSLRESLRTELRSHPDFRVRTTRWWFVHWPLRAPSLVIRGLVTASNDSMTVQLSEVRLRGPATPMSPVRAPLVAWSSLSDSLTYRVLLAVWDSLSPLALSLPRQALPRTPEGLSAFLNAEQLVAAGQWEHAYRAYWVAETLDPSCWLCSWRLNDVERWLGREHDPVRVQRIVSHIGSFPDWYKTLIRAAQLPLPERLDSLHRETAQWRDFFLGYLQLGDETFHRGPLEGHPRAEAVPAFEMAANYRPDFAPAWEHVAWVDIAEGDSSGAVHALAALDQRIVGDDPFAITVRKLLTVAFAFRFLPEALAIDSLQSVLRDSVASASPNLGAGPRMLGAFDVPAGQVAFGAMLAQSPAHDLKQSGLIAQTLGSVALGRPTEALALAQRLAAASPVDSIIRFRADLEQMLALLERANIRPGSPFFRAVTRLRLADQATRRGDVGGARRELIWHEHTDVIGIPTELPQTAEVDWALGTEARWRLANLPASSAEKTNTCRAYRDVARLWNDGEPLYRARADTARQRLTELHCGS